MTPPGRPPVRRGLFVPPFDVLAEPSALVDLAVRAEAAGWDGFFVWDHLLYAEPVRAVADPWIGLAAVAAATSRLVIGPMVTPLSRRRPHVLARQAVTLDRLSGGRLVLGFGLGDDGAVGEMSRFGEEADPRVRAAVLDEGLDVLAALLSGEVVDHEGPHHTARGVRFLPAPVRPGGIPVWIAGRWPAAAPQRRAARHDGYFPISVPEPGALVDAHPALAAVVAGAAGDASGGRPFDVVVDVPVGEDPSPWAAAGATWVLTRLGPYRMDLAECRRVADAGPAADAS